MQLLQFSVIKACVCGGGGGGHAGGMKFECGRYAVMSLHEFSRKKKPVANISV